LRLRALAVCTSALGLSITTWGGVVHAQPDSAASSKQPKLAALQRARDAWNNGDFDIAPGLFLDAINAGGLQKFDVVDAYTRIGASLTMAHKTQAALTVFRNTALLDPGFKVPPESGKAVVALAERARREQARVGSLTIAAQVQEEIEAGASIPVDVSVAPTPAPLVEAISIEARDPLTAHSWAQSRSLSAHLHFDVPARLTLPDATLVIVLEARDAHDNHLGSIEKRVHVAAAPPEPAPPLAAPVVAVSAGTNAYHDETPPADAHKGGFWSTAWPYVLGSVALAAGGAAVYLALRPTADATVGAPRVNVVP
jgi:hypothetical protein